MRENGENTHPILVFLITDAEPHYKHDNGSTAQAERRELENLGLYNNDEDFDAFDILDTIIGSHDGKLIIVPIIYSTRSGMRFYVQAAKLTGGVCISAYNTSSY